MSASSCNSGVVYHSLWAVEGNYCENVKKEAGMIECQFILSGCLGGVLGFLKLQGLHTAPTR